MNKTYWEIVSSCKLLNYTESDIKLLAPARTVEIRTEIWEDTKYTISCIWLPLNNSQLPTTITYKLK